MLWGNADGKSQLSKCSSLVFQRPQFLGSFTERPQILGSFGKDPKSAIWGFSIKSGILAMSWKLGDLSYKNVHFFVMVHDFICIYLGKIWPIYRKIMQNIPTSRNPNDMLHIFNLYKYMYTYNVHAVMSSIVWTRRLSLLTPLQSGGGYISRFSHVFFTHFWGRCWYFWGRCWYFWGRAHGNLTEISR